MLVFDAATKTYYTAEDYTPTPEIPGQTGTEMPPAEPTTEERIAALEEQNEMLTECILELSELLYN